jgi:two-component system cell cycle response regulator
VSSPGGGADHAEADALRVRLRELHAAAAANEQKWQRALAREIELLRAETLPRLLEQLTQGLAAAYGLEVVQLVLEDHDHEIRHLLLGDGERPESFAGVRFVDTLAGLAPQVAALRRPWLGAWVRADHELLFPLDSGVRTLALLPLARQGRTTGLLAFGSRDPQRFNERLGVDILQHLASIVAVCLENAINRARVLRAGLADYLTGWHNRRYLHLRLREELARAQRAQRSVSCLMLDVDHFKSVNDAYGHLGGDEVLREVAARIDAQVRASDSAARYGGDEFVLLLPDTSLEDAVRLGERIRAAMAPPVVLPGGRSRAVTLSIGAAELRPTRAAADLKALAERLLAEADAALYRAKAAGRDRVVASRG